MAGGLGKCSKIRHIVRLRQLLRRWRDQARMSSFSRSVPSDVPVRTRCCLRGDQSQKICRACNVSEPSCPKESSGSSGERVRFCEPRSVGFPL
uniref:Uncharacterized protein n=1 Tax=Brassica oleracea TaxID=3712 RepID=A0A3P6CWI3_BRAOL|nr:unnamed protein product [Brassica oleracea]